MGARALVVRGDAGSLPLRAGSVNLIITSPPYWGQRSYQDDGEHYSGQIGDERTPADYLDNLIAVTREWLRALADDGSLWINLGDKRAGSGAPGTTSGFTGPRVQGQRSGIEGAYPQSRDVGGAEVRRKSLMGLPWRYALRCVDELGLILRAEVIWDKPNGLPESVKDRVRVSHEHWFHFTKAERYYAAIDEIREPHAPQSLARARRNRVAPDHSQNGVGNANTLDPSESCNPLGRLPGSVRRVATDPLKVPQWARDKYDLPAHFAAFPQEWPRWIILGWSARHICTACGTGRSPVTERGEQLESRVGADGPRGTDPATTTHGDVEQGSTLGTVHARRILGYACACTPFTKHKARARRPDRSRVPDGQTNPNGDPKPGGEYERVGPWREYHLDDWEPPPTRPAVVLDPFGGTGTVAMVAEALGRIGVTLDRSGSYSALAHWRVHESGHARKSLARTAAERQGRLL